MEKCISVIIPTYNRRDKICRALDSVFAQNVREAIGEIIVVDDGSTDNTIEVIDEYRETHKEIGIIILIQANQGPSAARNNGMTVAKYDYIAMLDSDDEWLPEKTAIQLEVFGTYEDASFVGGNSDDVYMKILGRPITNVYKASLKDICLKSFPVTPSVLMKKEIFDKLGGFDESIHCYEDCDYFQRICAAGYGYYFVPTQVVVCDREKKPFGESGLSANLKQAHIDSIKSIKKLRRNKDISFQLYSFLRLFYFAKYIRRVILSKVWNHRMNQSV